MITLDYSDNRPIFQQVVEKLQIYILKGILPPDYKLPSVRSLAAELSVNPNTIQKAYSELEREGFLYTVKGKGAFVRFDDSLLDVRKSEIAEHIADLVMEAADLKIAKDDLFTEVEEILKKGKGKEI